MPQEQHVLGTAGIACWCEPKIEEACPSCEGEPGSTDCPFCHGTGWSKQWSDKGPFLVIHRINRPKQFS